MTATTYWQGSTLVVDWQITNLAGEPTTATVTGEVTRPEGNTAPMTVVHVPDEQLYRASYVVQEPGTHGWRLQATGDAVGAVEGSIVAQRSLLGMPPITVDPGTDVGMVRLLATDLDEVSPMFSDAHIKAMLTLEHGRVRRAAAQALDTVATSEVLISKVIRTLDLQTDGAKVAAELRQRAKGLRQQDDDLDDDGPWGIDIVNYDPWAAYRHPIAGT